MNNIGKKITTLGIILFVSAIFLTINNSYIEVKAEEKTKEVISLIKEKDKLLKEESKTLPIININGYDYIGMIIIPKINLELPVMEEYEQDSLSIAPNRYYGSILTNDLIICGHNYKSHFRYLNELRKNDKVIFKDFNEKEYIYEVIESQIISPYDINKMINSDYDLTLYTCTSDGLRRLAIRCNRVTN